MNLNERVARPGGLAGHAIAAMILLLSPSVAISQASVDASSATNSQFELVFWQSVSNSDDRAQFEAYLAKFPTGVFAALARAKIAVLDRQSPAAPKSVVSPAALVQPMLAPPPFTPPPPIVAAPAPTPTPAASPASVAASSSLSDQLRALGQTQGRRSDAEAVAAAGLPQRPVLTRVSPPVLPAQFCSAVERNSYYDTVYKAGVDRAGDNNGAAVAHMRLLQNLYQEAIQRGDTRTANLYASEAQDYDRVAKEVHADRSAFDPLFNKIMELPINTCVASK